MLPWPGHCSKKYIAFGYDLGLIGGATIGIQNELKLTEFEMEAVVAMCKIGAMFGVFIGSILMDIYGRRLAMGIIGAFYFVGPFIMVNRIFS